MGNTILLLQCCCQGLQQIFSPVNTSRVGDCCKFILSSFWFLQNRGYIKFTDYIKKFVTQLILFQGQSSIIVIDELCGLTEVSDFFMIAIYDVHYH